MLGWDAKARAEYEYPPGSGNILKYQHSGDPVRGTGDLDPASSDKRWMQTTGPITFAPGDSTEILAAVIVSQGQDALSSLTSVKQLDDFAQRLYENGFNPPNPPARPEVTVARLSGEVTLSWGLDSEEDPGDYEFEGYTVWQGPGPSGPWTEIETWDVDNDKTNGLIDTVVNATSGTEQPVVIRGIVNSGLAYSYTFDEDKLTNRPLYDQSPYYFQVSAFSFAFAGSIVDIVTVSDSVQVADTSVESIDTMIDTAIDTTIDTVPDPDDTTIDTTIDTAYDTTWLIELVEDEWVYSIRIDTIREYTDINGKVVPKGDRFLESARTVTVVPQSPLAGTHYNISSGEQIPVTHPSGGSDGVVTATVVDPGALTGHSYRVSFESDGEGGYLWHLDDITTSTRLLEDQTNQTGNAAYFVIDGMYIVVSGPATPGVLDWDIPFGNRRFTWANSDGFHLEGFNGAIGWGGPGDFFGSYDPVPPAEHVNIRLILAQDRNTDEDYHWYDADFDIDNDPNMSYGYRYMRGTPASLPGSLPQFDPYVTIPGAGSYGFMEFAKNVPLTAWNIDVDPPQQLVVGFLENYTALASLDGFWYPRNSDDYAEGGDAEGTDGVASNGPREWLWISTDPYSETPNPTYTGHAINDEMPWFCFITVSRRGTTAFFEPSGTDAFDIIYAKINLDNDVFEFSTADYVATHTQTGTDLDEITAVPNPFYLSGDYDPAPGDYVMKFHHLPETCTISIYSLSGKLVRVIEKDDASTNSLEWNMLTANGLPVGSGIYIYVVDAPGFGQKIGKVAVFVEQEVLRIY